MIFFEEWQMLWEIVVFLVVKYVGLVVVCVVMVFDCGYDELLWWLLCEQVGVVVLVILEELGGVGGEFVDVVIVVQELGWVLVFFLLLGIMLVELVLLVVVKLDV